MKLFWLVQRLVKPDRSNDDSIFYEDWSPEHHLNLILLASSTRIQTENWYENWENQNKFLVYLFDTCLCHLVNILGSLSKIWLDTKILFKKNFVPITAI